MGASSVHRVTWLPDSVDVRLDPAAGGVVAVVGEALIDMHLADDRARLFPGGAALNCAVFLARLGVPTVFAGGIGDNRLGHWLGATLRDAGVALPDTAYVDAPTPLAIVDTGPTGDATYGFHLADTALVRRDPATVLGGVAFPIAAVQVGGLALAVEPVCRQIETMIEPRGLYPLVLVDPNIRPEVVGNPGYLDRVRRICSSAAVVKASAEDVAFLYPGSSTDELLHLLLESGVQLAVVTRGSDGVVAATRQHRLAVPAVPVDVADTIGAGDAFGAAIAASLRWLRRSTPESLAGLTLAELHSMLEFATTVAALQCARPSASSATLDEVTAFRNARTAG